MKDFNYQIEYLGGHPNWEVSAKAYIRINSETQSVDIMSRGYNSELKLVEILKENIVAIDFEEKKPRPVGKATAGAKIGDILKGGIELLTGGALGASEKNKPLLYITVNHNGMNFNVTLKTGKYTNRICSDICSFYTD